MLQKLFGIQAPLKLLLGDKVVVLAVLQVRHGATLAEGRKLLLGGKQGQSTGVTEESKMRSALLNLLCNAKLLTPFAEI